MRELKFRIWDKENEVFHYTDSLVTRVELVVANFARSGRGLSAFPKIILSGQLCKNINSLPVMQDNYIIQQGTGVPDMNKKEIYEGDAIRYRGRVGIVRYSSGAFRCEWNDQTDDEIGLMVTADMEVVGVKYE
jgi:hypothetical protein